MLFKKNFVNWNQNIPNSFIPSGLLIINHQLIKIALKLINYDNSTQGGNLQENLVIMYSV